MDNYGKVSDNNENQITIKVETRIPGSNNSNLSSAQFAPLYTEIDITTC